MKINSIRPGCKDVFHAFLVKDTKYSGEYDIPCISSEQVNIEKVIPFSKALKSKDYKCWIHFYEDDYKIQRIWNYPKKYLPILKKIQRYN